MKIGIAGTGRMGTAIGLRLLSLGHEITAWNRTVGKTQTLADAGAKIAAAPADVSSRSEIIMTILTNAAALDAVYLGPRGLLSGEIGGKLFVEMSTVRPETERRLEARAGAQGASLIDCPVGGTVGPAMDGRLFAFAGGDEAAVARVRPVLEGMCRRIEHVGNIGAGATMKLAANLATQVFWQSFGEALALCEPVGLDPSRLMEIFTETSGAPNVLKHRSGQIAAALRGTDISPVNFDVDSVRKDLRTMVEEAAARNFRLPVAERALECFDAASRDGFGGSDCAMVPVIWSRRACAAARPDGSPSVKSEDSTANRRQHPVGVRPGSQP